MAILVIILVIILGHITELRIYALNLTSLSNYFFLISCELR